MTSHNGKGKKHEAKKVHPSWAMGTWKNPGAQGAYAEAPARGHSIGGVHKKAGEET